MRSEDTEPAADIPSSGDVFTTPTETNGSSPVSNARRPSDFDTETDEFGVTHGLSSWATGRYIRLCQGTGTRTNPGEPRPITCIMCARKWKSMREYFERVSKRIKNLEFAPTEGRRRRLEDR